MSNKYIYYPIISILLITFAGISTGCTGKAAPGIEKPNIIIIFTDDHGYADLGIQGKVQDIITPNIDLLGQSGIRMTSGYVTAPQCTPSRAGIISGQYQQRMGVDKNGTLPLPLDAVLLPQRMQNAGYITGMVGKWHLDPNHLMRSWLGENYPELASKEKITRQDITFEMRLPYFAANRGFQETFDGTMYRYYANYDLEGNDIDWQYIADDRYRLDVQSDAAVTFIERNHEEPFFLYLAYYAPHLPLEATEKYLARFPGEMPNRRRICLAMISAMDDGVGRIVDKLRERDIYENTLIFFISDNGAPLKLHKEDLPIEPMRASWDGSLNHPLIGEKGMLSEGGIRVPFLVSWPAVIPKGLVYNEPVISLDVAATSLAVAGLDHPAELDGVNLIPYLTGEKDGIPHEVLYWRFFEQSAIRMGEWKFLKAGPREFLFNLGPQGIEKENLILLEPEKAMELKSRLNDWAGELYIPGLPGEPLKGEEVGWYDHYFPDSKVILSE
jgi:arylsulfatase A-like enzyme